MSRYIWISKFYSSPVSFGAIAVMTTEYQVADSVGAAAAAGQHVIDLECGLAAPTVDAAPPKFLQQVAADFPATQLPPLIEDPTDLRMLEQGRIELDPLDLDPTPGDPSTKATGPGEHIANA